jgi:hypothetical protein
LGIPHAHTHAYAWWACSICKRLAPASQAKRGASVGSGLFTSQAPHSRLCADTMCGILAVFGLTGSPVQNRRELLKLSKLLRHRGPDANSAWVNAAGDAWLLHERLVVVDVTDAGR